MKSATYALGLAMAILMMAKPASALNNDSIAITITIGNQLAVNIETENFTDGTSRALGESFVLSTVLSVDNESHFGGIETSGLVQSYKLSGAISGVDWFFATAPSEDHLVMCAIFTGASSVAPAASAFTNADDYVTGEAIAASDSVYYGTAGEDGLSVSPDTGPENDLWLAISMPTSSSVDVSGNLVITLYILAELG